MSGQKHCSAERIPLEPFEPGREYRGLRLRRPGAEEAVAGGHQPLRNGHDLLDRLPFTVDHLRMSLPQTPVVVQLGEWQLLGRKMSQPVQCSRGLQAAGGDLRQQALELVPRHATCASGPRYPSKIVSASDMLLT